MKLEEEDNIKGETDKKPKFLENGGKASLISNSNFAVNSVNVANIGNLNFDGLFLDISKNQISLDLKGSKQLSLIVRTE